MKQILTKSIQMLIIIFVVVVSSVKNATVSSFIENDNIEKQVDLSQMSKKIEEYNYDELYGVKATYTGDLTGYSFDCPLCGGTLGCAYTYNIKDGTTTYPDKDYGELLIVASSKNLACGSVIRFNSSRISDETVYAIVLDRGVLGTAIDLLVESEEYASKYIGRSKITYDVIRDGWTHES